MAFASDTFAGTFATELSAYSASWSKQTGFSNNALIGENNASVITTAGTYAVYQHSGSPAGANYSVFVDITQNSSNTAGIDAGPAGRMQAAADTFYCALQMQTPDEIRLYKCVSGSFTQLGSGVANNLSTGVPQEVELRMNGTTISVHLDGGAAVISVTDSAISTAGKAGIITQASRTTGGPDDLRISNFVAEDAAASGNAALGGSASTSGQTAPSINTTIAL